MTVSCITFGNHLLQIEITGRLKNCCDSASWLINYGRGEFYSITCFLIFGLLVQFLKWILLIQFDTKTKFKHEWTIKNEQSNTILSHKNRKKGQVRRKGHKGYHLLFPAMEYRHSWQTVNKFNFVSIVNFPFHIRCVTKLNLGFLPIIEIPRNLFIFDNLK